MNIKAPFRFVALSAIIYTTAGLYTFQAAAAGLNPVSWQASFNLTLNPGLDSEAIDTLQEGKIFLDVNYLDKAGGGIGFIGQQQEYVSGDSLSNSFTHLNGWFAFYPSGFGGKITTTLDYFDSGSNEFTETTVTTTTPGQGNGRPITVVTVTRFEESSTVINPSISYLNQNKNVFIDLGYAISDYENSADPTSDLEVKQWSPAIGFGLNDNYDWFQFRYYGVELSHGLRTAGIDSSDAFSISWTHWLRDNDNRKLDSLYVGVLTGERLFGVEQDVKKIFNVADQQTGSIVAGATWKFSNAVNLALYTGYEKYTDLVNALDYDNIFIDATLSFSW